MSSLQGLASMTGFEVETADRLRRWGTASAVLASALLASCGGGGGGVFGGVGSSSVTSVSASPLRYGIATVVSVSGSGMDQGIQLEAGPGCINVTRIGEATATQVSFSCTVKTIEHDMRVVDASGRKLASLYVVVPQPQVTIVTSKGTIVVELDVLRAPISSENFHGYVTGAAAFYRNTLFHEAVAGVSISAGGYTNQLTNGINTPVLKANTTPAVTLESNNGLKNLRGTIAMLRDPADGNTVKSQFFINLQDNPQHDFVSEAQRGHAVFGRVVAGMDVADAIGAVPVRFILEDGRFGVPVTPLPITSITQSR